MNCVLDDDNEDDGNNDDERNLPSEYNGLFVVPHTTKRLVLLNKRPVVYLFNCNKVYNTTYLFSVYFLLSP